MAADISFFDVFARGVTAPRRSLGQKAVTWIRPASVPANAGDGFTYNAPWQMVTGSGRALSESAVLQLSAAMACVRLLSQTISTLPFGMFRRLANGEREPASDHLLYELLHNQPNPDMSAVDFWQVMVASMLLRGNAFAEKLLFNGRLVGLQPLDASLVSWTKRADGSLRYFYADSQRGRRELGREQMWHIPAFTLDGVLGISPIAYGASVFGSALSAEEAAQGVFESGMAASGFVTMPNGEWLEPEQRDQLRGHLDQFARNREKRFKSFILEGGMSYTALSMNPEDAQMLESRIFSVEEICRWYGVPPALVGHGDKVSHWGTGLEQMNIGFLTYVVAPWLKKLEQAVRRSLLTPADKQSLFGEFNVAALLRADFKSRMEGYGIAVEKGLKTRAEVRKLENDTPLGGNSDKLTVQANMTLLDDLGKLLARNNTTPATEVTQ